MEQIYIYKYIYMYIYDVYSIVHKHIIIVIISPDGLLASTEAVQERIGFALSEPIRIAGYLLLGCSVMSVSFICLL
jgi:hypothetical protein